MKQVPIKSYGSIALSTNKSHTRQAIKSVYERQMMQRQAHERKLEQQREEQAQERARRETLETTFQPRINGSFQPKDGFFERQQKLIDKRKQREEVLATIQQECDDECTFEPTLNPVSLYIVEQMQKQKRLNTRSGILAQQSGTRKPEDFEDLFFSLREKSIQSGADKVSAFTSRFTQEESVYDKLYKSNPQRFCIKVKEDEAKNETQSIHTSKAAQQTHVDKMLEYQRKYQSRREEMQKQYDAELALMKQADPERQKRVEELLQRRQKRIDAGQMIPRGTAQETTKQAWTPNTEYFHPQTQSGTKSAYNPRASSAEDFLTRMERYEKQRWDKIGKMREEQRHAEDQLMRPTPEINRGNSVRGSQQDTVELLLQRGRERQQRIEDAEKKRREKMQLEEEETIKNANSFKPGAVPQGIRTNLIIHDRRSKQDVEILYQQRNPDIASRLRTLGNGSEQIGQRVLDSTYKFINRIRNKEPEKNGLYGQQNPFVI